MIGKVIGALVGRELGRRSNRGASGALTGMMAAGALRRMGPLGLILGGAYVAKKAMNRRKGRY